MTPQDHMQRIQDYPPEQQIVLLLNRQYHQWLNRLLLRWIRYHENQAIIEHQRYGGPEPTPRSIISAAACSVYDITGLLVKSDKEDKIWHRYEKLKPIHDFCDDYKERMLVK